MPRPFRIKLHVPDKTVLVNDIKDIDNFVSVDVSEGYKHMGKYKLSQLKVKFR